jgi:surface protein
LSARNKLLIRCAWASTSALASAGYGSGWAPGTCPATFTTKAELQTAVREYNYIRDAATATYGPIADWDVSAITDMSYLFNRLTSFNADISGWDTSSVTTMYVMFQVRSARALGPQALSESGLFPVHAELVVLPPPQALPPPGSHLSPPHRMPSLRLGSSRGPSTSR